MKRRGLILGVLGGSGALVVGWCSVPARSRLGSAGDMPVTSDGVALNGWIRIAPDNSVVLAMPRSEMGQGVHTALSMLVAEELDLPLSAIRLEQAGFGRIYGNVTMLVAGLPFHPLDSEGGQPPVKVRLGEWMAGKVARELGINATGGSSSVADGWDVLRTAAATARASLLGAASLQWKLPVEELQASNGVISHPSGRSAGYGELARFAAATPPGEVRLKAGKDWKLIGRSAPRVDIPSKVDGSARFGTDVRLPGMLYASLRMCPMLGGSAGRTRGEPALALPGVHRLVQLPGYAGGTAGVAVVASSWWQAQKAAQALEIEWHQRPRGALDTRQIEAELAAAAKSDAGYVFHAAGAVTQAEDQAVQTVEAAYQAPYLAHAAMEPINCTAKVTDGMVEVWAPTQVPGMARAVAAQVAGVSEDNVKVHVTLIGGGFGRRLDVDFIAQAVRIAMDCSGAPVQLVWPRDEDIRHDFYRPMHAARMKAGLDAAGNLISLRINSAGDAITPRWIERSLPLLAGPMDFPDKTGAEGLFDLPYAIPNQRMSHVATRMGVPVGFWRSVGHSHNAFFSECFIDEVAHTAGRDPLAFRRALLANAPRYRAVLELAAEKARWAEALPPGHARGVALHESFGSIVAQVAEVSIREGRLHVHGVVCAIDCGTVINPDIVRQQMEGAVVFALSAALNGRIDIRGGVVQQSNFHDHPLTGLGGAPHVQTWIVPSMRSPGGVGEPGVPPLAPAVANALFMLTGDRRRGLPFDA